MLALCRAGSLRGRQPDTPVAVQRVSIRASPIAANTQVIADDLSKQSDREVAGLIGELMKLQSATISSSEPEDSDTSGDSDERKTIV